MEEGEGLLDAIARITGDGHIQLRAGAVPVWSEDQKRLLAMLLGESLIDVMALGSDEIDRLLRKALQQKLHSEAASGLSGRLGSGFGPSSINLFEPHEPDGGELDGADRGKGSQFLHAPQCRGDFLWRNSSRCHGDSEWPNHSVAARLFIPIPLHVA